MNNEINIPSLRNCFHGQKDARCRVSQTIQLDDGWPESEKDVFQAALSMVVVKNSR